VAGSFVTGSVWFSARYDSNRCFSKTFPAFMSSHVISQIVPVTLEKTGCFGGSPETIEGLALGLEDWKGST